MKKFFQEIFGEKDNDDKEKQTSKQRNSSPPLSSSPNISLSNYSPPLSSPFPLHSQSHLPSHLHSPSPYTSYPSFTLQQQNYSILPQPVYNQPPHKGQCNAGPQFVAGGLKNSYR